MEIKWKKKVEENIKRKVILNLLEEEKDNMIERVELDFKGKVL